MANFLSPLNLEYLDGRTWKLNDPFSYAIGAPEGEVVVKVPVGFLTDFASIPHIFWSLIPPTGWYGKAAVIHDFLYQHAHVGDLIIDQKFADETLNEAMCVLAASWVLNHGRTRPGHPQLPHGELRSLAERECIYRGVRYGGFSTWNKYRAIELATGATIHGVKI